jgi:hypothetical protein
VSEPTTAAPAPPKPKGKTYGGLSRNQWLIVGGVFAAALAYIVWKRRQAAAATAAGQSNTSSVANSDCTDSDGNPIPCADADALQQLESQLAGAQGSGFGSGGGGSDGGGYVAGNGSTGTTTTTGGTGTGTGSGSGGGTGTTTKTAGPISNLQAASTGTTTATIRWNAAANATGGYAYKVTQLNGKQVGGGNTRSTSVSLTGLHPGWTYNFGVQGLPGGPGDNIHFTTKGG